MYKRVRPEDKTLLFSFLKNKDNTYIFTSPLIKEMLIRSYSSLGLFCRGIYQSSSMANKTLCFQFIVEQLQKAIHQKDKELTIANFRHNPYTIRDYFNSQRNFFDPVYNYTVRYTYEYELIAKISGFISGYRTHDDQLRSKIHYDIKFNSKSFFIKLSCRELVKIDGISQVVTKPYYEIKKDINEDFDFYFNEGISTLNHLVIDKRKQLKPLQSKISTRQEDNELILSKIQISI